MECVFCGDEIDMGKGKIVVGENGSSKFYCSSKCEKNHLKLGKDPKHTEWASK